jgi:hypothetical protein
MANSRIYYAVQSVRLRGPSGTDVPSVNDEWDRVRGLQTVAINTNFNLEPIYQMGQLELYDNFEEVPDVEVTLNKVLDGFPLIYGMAQGTGTLNDIANNRCGVQLGIFKDSNAAATGTTEQLLQIEPAYVSTATYTFSTDGNFTEDVTLVANDKEWLTTQEDFGAYGATDTFWTTSPTGFGIARRQQFNLGASILPNSGSNAGPLVRYTNGGIAPGSRITSLTITANLNREEIRELGQRRPFIRYINFPVEITCEIEVTAASGDLVGVNNTNAVCANPKALENKQIKVVLCDGTTFDLGTKNKLTTVNYQGGDTGGGNATVTYSYQNYNDFTFVQGTGYDGGTAISTKIWEDMSGQLDFNLNDGSPT